MITCTNCGTPNTPDSRFCKQCATALQPPPLVPDFGPAVLDNPTFFTQQPQNNTQDRGYFLIAVVMLAHTLLWRVGVLLQGALSDTFMTFYKLMSILSFFLIMAQCIIMLVFTKKPNYRILIIITLVIEALSSLYLVFQNIVR